MGDHFTMRTSQLIVLAFCFCAVLAGPAKYKDCGSSATITELSVDPCTTQPVCQAVKGNDITLTMKFTPNSNSNTIKSSAHGILAGIPVPFAHDTDACKYATCPVQNGV